MRKQSRSIARKYASALFELYQLPQLDALKSSLFEAVRLWEDNSALRESLLNPALPLEERSQALRSLAQLIRPEDTNFSNFLVLLLRNKRLPELRLIADALSGIIDEVKRVLALRISSAFEIPLAEKDLIKSRIESEYGSMASIEWAVDPALIGGMIIKSGDKLLDGSLKGALDRLRVELLA